MIVRGTCPLVCAFAIHVSVLGLSEGRAQAALFTASLTYEASAKCPDRLDFEALVRARLGYDPFSESAPEHVLVQISSPGSGLEGRLEWRDVTGKWVGDQRLPVASNDCGHLVRALAMALAVQIQLLATTTTAPIAVTASPKSTGPPPEVAAPRPVPQSPVDTISSNEPSAARFDRGPPAPPTARRPGPIFAMGVGTSVGFGMSSRPVLLGRVLGSLAWPHLSVELAAEASLPTTTRRADGAGFSQQHLLGSAAACALSTRWRACLLANGGAVRMMGEDIDRPSSATVPLAEAGLRVGIVQLLGPAFFVDAHADGVVNVIRWTASLDQFPVWTAPRFSAVLGVDLGCHVR